MSYKLSWTFIITELRDTPSLTLSNTYPIICLLAEQSRFQDREQGKESKFWSSAHHIKKYVLMVLQGQSEQKQRLPS